MACYTFNCNFVDKCFSFKITFSSLVSFCTIHASTRCCSLASFSSDFSMQIGSTDVALWSCLVSYMPMSFASMQKLNYKCFSCICLELSSTQIVSFHYTLSILHILKMMKNVTMTLQPTVQYSTLLSLLFSTPFQILFFSTIPLPCHAFIYVHSSALPFPLLFAIVFQLHYLHSYYCEFQNFENTHNFQQQTQITLDS